METKKGFNFCSTPKSVSISITGKCNLNCKYCFYTNEMERLKDLDTQQWLSFFEQLKALRVMDVSLTGGEAFTRPDLFELIDGIIKNKMRYNILSNGTLIDEKTLQSFSVGKRRARLDYIQISIDGSAAEIHNKSRPASFDRAVRGLKLLKKNNFPVVVRVTINKHNLNDLKNIATLLLEDIGLPSFSTNEAMPIGSGCRNDSEISLSSPERLKGMKILKELLFQYPGRLHSTAGPQSKLKMYMEMEQAKNGEEVITSWQMGCLSSCGCVYSKIDILHDGTIVPCCMLPGVKLGNILTDSLLETWQNHPTMEVLRERSLIQMSEVPGCKECKWATFCNGSCPGMAHQLTGNFNLANPEDCIKIFLKANNLVEFRNAN
jgi:SynChlorMet cassette radical SAM/SPASM protein ScmE